MTTRSRFDFLLRWFPEHMPDPQSELRYDNPFQLLVAVMLSAQCTDKRVNMVTPALFEAYPTPERMAEASVDEILTFVRSVSYPNSKAAHLKAMAQQLVSDFGGCVPDTVETLTTLPGVGRKTANVVCAVIWNRPTMAVDTHIFRVSERIGLTTNSKNPLQTERALVRYIPEELIPKAHHWLLLHGRYVCTARNPKCADCGIRSVCRYYKNLAY
ncbi:MAG: endonuclease III [Bacteroidales bacterium]|jgi:endonuclease-3|nr:endonuclease III [Bacteroidales bacterium]MBR4547547.1 endonuclease III [Paludibacteraceae bacterium]MBR6145522.1 endonuclease III [Paludibacteraceae bacterium]